LTTNLSEKIQTGMGGLIAVVGVVGVLAPNRLGVSGADGAMTA